jgi:hypothetical protein
MIHEVPEARLPVGGPSLSAAPWPGLPVRGGLCFQFWRVRTLTPIRAAKRDWESPNRSRIDFTSGIRAREKNELVASATN